MRRPRSIRPRRAHPRRPMTGCLRQEALGHGTAQSDDRAAITPPHSSLGARASATIGVGGAANSMRTIITLLFHALPSLLCVLVSSTVNFFFSLLAHLLQPLLLGLLPEPSRISTCFRASLAAANRRRKPTSASASSRPLLLRLPADLKCISPHRSSKTSLTPKAVDRAAREGHG